MSFYGQLCTIPRNASEINLIAIEDGNGNVMQTAAQQWERLNAFIENNDCLVMLSEMSLKLPGTTVWM